MSLKAIAPRHLSKLWFKVTLHYAFNITDYSIKFFNYWEKDKGAQAEGAQAEGAQAEG